MQILRTVPPKKGFLFGRRKRHACVKSVFSSYQVMV